MISISKPVIGKSEEKAALQVLESGMIACGNVVTEFENAFKHYLNAPHAVATTSGTTALDIAIRAAGITKGDKVLTTPFSFIASCNSIVHSGAMPVFADIDDKTFNISPDAIEEVLDTQKDIKALLVVHLYGQCCNMDRITDIVKEHKLILIEDCAQAHGAEWKGKKAGTFGNVAAFSFYATKNMTTGEGGMIVTDSDEIAANARLLINHGMDRRYYHDMIGYNFRMTNLSASLGLCQLKKLDDFNSLRGKNADFFNHNMDNGIFVKPFTDHNAKHIYHQYTIRVHNGLRDKFTRHLEDNGIGYGIYYPLSIPEQSCYEKLGLKKDYRNTDRAKHEVISLPVHPSLTENEKIIIVKTVNSFRG